MASIEIPGYKILIPNKTWEREAEPFHPPNLDSELDMTQVVQLKRYSSKTEDEVIAYIQERAQNMPLFSGLDEQEELKKEEIPFSKILELLPPEDIEAIAKGQEDILNHLRKHHPAYSHQPNTTYLQVTNGIIPNKVLESVRAKEGELNELAYETLIDNAGLNHWCLRIRLDGKDKLPEKSEIEHLLEVRVRESDVLVVTSKLELYPNAADQIRLLYSALNFPEKIRRIKSDSKQFLRSGAFITVKETAECNTRRSLCSNLAGIVCSGIIEQSQKDQGTDFPIRHSEN